MASIEEFRELLHSGDLKKAFTDYELDFNSAEFDVFGSVKVEPYEVNIEWGFEEPNKIKMLKESAANVGSGKRITYLPWESEGVTVINLNGDSPRYFVTSHFSNCRFTIRFHDNSGKNVTVMHVAGNTKGGSNISGSLERDELEKRVEDTNVKRIRRLSVAGHKALGKRGREFMEERRAKADTDYYDTYARVFGIRKGNGAWIFYAQSLDYKGKIVEFKTV